MRLGERAVRDADHVLLLDWGGDSAPRSCATEYPSGVGKCSYRCLWHEPAELPAPARAQAFGCGELRGRFDLLFGASIHSLDNASWPL